MVSAFWYSKNIKIKVERKSMKQNKELFNLIKDKLLKNKTKRDSVIKIKNCYGIKL